MSKITVHRIVERINRHEPYEVILDGQIVDKLIIGNSKDYDLTPGHHSIYIRLRNQQSHHHNFEIKEGEHKIYRAEGVKTGNWILPIAFILVIANFVLKITLKIDSLYYFLIPGALLILYHFTFGSRKYLVLHDAS